MDRELDKADSINTAPMQHEEDMTNFVGKMNVVLRDPYGPAGMY